MPCYKLLKLKSAALLLLSSTSVTAAAGDLFHGSWGTSAQCARELIVANGSKHFAPFEISASWLQHGDAWCRLNWVNVVEQDDFSYAVTDAICGEDDNRDYRIRLVLQGEELKLIWNGEFENAGLRRC